MTFGLVLTNITVRESYHPRVSGVVDIDIKTKSKPQLAVNIDNIKALTTEVLTREYWIQAIEMN